MFTNYTNQWKGRQQQERIYSKNAERVPYANLFTDSAKDDLGVNLRKDRRGNTYRPQLPQPENDRQYRIIRYSKSVEDIKLLIGHLFGDTEADISASVVGERCFDEILKEVKKQEV